MIKFTNKEAENKAKNLLRACASKDRTVALDAQQSFASLLTSSLSQVIEQVSTTALIFGEAERYTRASGPPSIPIETYFGVGEGYMDIWSNGMPGGLASNHISGAEDYRFQTFNLDSAIDWNIKYAEAARLPVIAKGIQRLMQEVLLKSNFYGWQALSIAIGKARYAGAPNVMASTAKLAGATRKFQLDDVSRMITKLQRLNASWAGGTPIAQETGLTDLFVSPEAMEEVRRFVYNPQNTTAIPDTTESTVLGLPDEMRMDVYRNIGATEIFGIRLHTLYELGVNGVYTNLLKTVYTPAGTDPTFNPGLEDVVIGLDLSAGAFARVLMEDDENGDTFNLEVDDQYTKRSRRFGYFGGIEEGYLVGNDRAAIALVW